jgi:hypothetical protein
LSVEIIVAPDLADDGSAIIELALCVGLIGDGLHQAFEDGDDPHVARRIALGTLKRAMVAMAGLIGDLERRAT